MLRDASYYHLRYRDSYDGGYAEHNAGTTRRNQDSQVDVAASRVAQRECEL